MQWRNVNHLKDYNNDDVMVFFGNYTDFKEQDISFVSTSEKIRSELFSKTNHRNRFLAGRSFLRRAIGYVLQSGPYTGDFIVDEYGKPYISNFHTNFHFNISHTGNVIVAVFSLTRPVGIDIELKNRLIPQHLADYFLTDEEVREILSKDDWQHYFLRAWTRKEAVLKCIGCGFSGDPKSIKVPLGDNNLWAYKYSPFGVEIQAWHIIPLNNTSGIIGVVAV